jgi:hypothetical protein
MIIYNAAFPRIHQAILISLGSCLKGTGRSSWNGNFDILPSDDNVATNISRGKITVVALGEQDSPLSTREQTSMAALK